MATLPETAGTAPDMPASETAESAFDIQRIDDAVDTVRSRAHDITDQAADALQTGAAKVSSAIDAQLNAVDDTQQRWLAACRSSVRERPLTAVSIALLAGMLLVRVTR